MKISDYESKFLALLKDLTQAEMQHPQIKSLKLNIFEAAGLTRQEIRHSNVLAYLLNPNENHGLKDTFFKKFINHRNLIEYPKNSSNSPSPLKLALSEFDDLVVRREDIQIDILAWSPSNKIALIIENKIGANESLNQLSKYREKIRSDNRFKDYKTIFIYLTPFGEEGSDDEWINLSYQTIIETLEEIINQGSSSDDLSYFITHYLELLRKHVMNKDDDEIKSTCLSIYEKHRDILDLIYKNIDIGGSRIDAIQRFISDHKDLHINNQNSYWLSFNPQNLYELMPTTHLTREWHKQQKPLVFFFSLSESQIKIVIEVGPIKNLDYRNKLVEKLFLKLTNKPRSARSDTYTRVISITEKISSNKTIDELSSDEVLIMMNTLYQSVKKYIDPIMSIFEELNNNENTLTF